jgi:hypothetical protein
MQKIA